MKIYNTNDYRLILAMTVRYYYISTPDQWLEFTHQNRSLIDEAYEDVESVYERFDYKAGTLCLRPHRCGCGNVVKIKARRPVILSSCFECSDTIDTNWVLSTMLKFITEVN